MHSSADSSSAMAEHVWILLGIDPVEARIIVLGFQMGSEAEARAELRERLAAEGNEDVIYSAVFDMFGRSYGRQIQDWMIKSGVTTNEAAQAIRQIGTQMRNILRKASLAERRKRRKR